MNGQEVMALVYMKRLVGKNVRYTMLAAGRMKDVISGDSTFPTEILEGARE